MEESRKEVEREGRREVRACGEDRRRQEESGWNWKRGEVEREGEREKKREGEETK